MEESGNKKNGRNSTTGAGKANPPIEGTPSIWQHLSLGVGSPSGTTRAKTLKHNNSVFFYLFLSISNTSYTHDRKSPPTPK
jgi:hypothetical protein